MDARLLEIVLIAESKRTRSAEELLEWQLNSEFYGHDAYGINAASELYFGKSAAVLSLAEAAILAMTAQDPSLNPFDSAQSSRERGADLLLALLAADKIDKSQFDAASNSDVAFASPAGRRVRLCAGIPRLCAWASRGDTGSDGAGRRTAGGAGRAAH